MIRLDHKGVLNMMKQSEEACKLENIEAKRKALRLFIKHYKVGTIFKIIIDDEREERDSSWPMVR